MEYQVLSGPFNAGKRERDLNGHAVALAATSGIMAVLMLGLHGGPAITSTVTLYAFFG